MGIEMRNSSNSKSYLCMIKTTHLSDEPKKRVSLFCTQLLVTLASPNLLSFGKAKQKNSFFPLHFAHLFVTLHPGSDNKQITR